MDDMYEVYISQLHALIEEFVPKRSSNHRNKLLMQYIEKLERLLASDQDSMIEAKLRKASTRLRILEESVLDFKDSKSFFRYANKRLSGK